MYNFENDFNTKSIKFYFQFSVTVSKKKITNLYAQRYEVFHLTIAVRILLNTICIDIFICMLNV